MTSIYAPGLTVRDDGDEESSSERRGRKSEAL
jgi:hypothetical protein